MGLILYLAILPLRAAVEALTTLMVLVVLAALVVEVALIAEREERELPVKEMLAEEETHLLEEAEVVLVVRQCRGLAV
jgi:hypothetical protein